LKELLKKLKLIDYLQTELEIHKNEFVSKLSEHVDHRDMGGFSDTFDIFFSCKNEWYTNACQ